MISYKFDKRWHTLGGALLLIASAFLYLIGASTVLVAACLIAGVVVLIESVAGKAFITQKKDEKKQPQKTKKK